MERKSREPLLPSPPAGAVREFHSRQTETYWVELQGLTQVHLNDVTAIYCQVYKVRPERLLDVPEISDLKREVSEGPGFYEVKLAGNKPALDLRRKKLHGSKDTRILVRFGAIENQEEFQKAADHYLSKVAKVAMPLSVPYATNKYSLDIYPLGV